jgi:hypothetical protein
MLPRLSGPACAGVSVLLAALLGPAVASAAEDKEISGDQTLGGDHTYGTFTVKATGKLHVPHLSSDPNGGWLTITANTITIFSGGVIEADGAGYAGKDGADGQSAGGTAGGGGKGATPGLPGGGGGFFANGGSGTMEPTAGMCQDFGGSAPGGAAFFDMALKTPMLGASGGAANVQPTTATAGGSGGGGIILRAAVVMMDGTITVNGSKPFATGGVAPGGGSGGTIKILAALLTGGGTLEAKGGDGAHGNGSSNPPPIAANNGGGGSGGAIILSLPMGAMAPTSLKLTITGGTNGCGTGAPNGGVVYDPLPPGKSCVDLDNDGFDSNQCGGPDCDDTDSMIHPGVPEVCDGRDNDCNGTKDDGANLCSPGNACTNGTCQAVVPDGGAGGSGGSGGATAGPPPDHVEFGSGCSVPARGGLAEGAVGAGIFALGTLALAAARRPRRRARKR